MHLHQTEEEYQRTYRSETQRLAIFLAVFALIVAITIVMPSNEFWNFPCNSPCSHITLWLFPTFITWIVSWVGYIASMGIYVSEDRFGRRTREVARRIGHLFVWWYPITVFFVTISGGISFNLPDWAQSPYWLTVFGLFGFYLIWSLQSIGMKIVGKGSALDKPLDRFLKVGGIGMNAIVEKLVREWRAFLKKPGMKSIDKSTKRQALLAFLAPIEAVILSIAHFALGLSGLTLLYVFGAPLYALIFAGVIVGARVAKKTEAHATTQEEEVSVVFSG